MTREDLLRELAAAEEDGDPIPVLVSDLSKLSFDELPIGVGIQPLERIDAKGGHHLALNGSLVRDNAKLVAVIEEYGARKYWAGSLGGGVPRPSTDCD